MMVYQSGSFQSVAPKKMRQKLSEGFLQLNVKHSAHDNAEPVHEQQKRQFHDS